MWARRLLAVFLAGVALPAFAQEREWTFDTGDEDAYLVFGVPESEDVGVSFGCRLQSGEINIFIPEAGDGLKPDQKIKIVISVADKDFRYEGLTAPNEMTGSSSAETTIEARDPVFTALSTTDRFMVRAGSEENTFPLAGADFQSLVRACGKA
jgi:hypothetical protein